MRKNKKNPLARIVPALLDAVEHILNPFSPSTKTPPSLKRTAAPDFKSQPYARHTAIRPESHTRKSFKDTPVSSGLELQPSVKDTSENPGPVYTFSPGSVIYPIPEMTADQIASIRYNEAPEPSPPDWIADDGSLVYVLDDVTLDPPEKTIPSSSIVAIGAWEKTHPPDPILRQIAICFDLEDGRELHLTVGTDSAALMAKSILNQTCPAIPRRFHPKTKPQPPRRTP